MAITKHDISRIQKKIYLSPSYINTFALKLGYAKGIVICEKWQRRVFLSNYDRLRFLLLNKCNEK